jgi:hypothetical protein
MRRQVVAIIITLLASIGAAEAKQAVWGEVKGWTVYGETETSACWARTVYEDGVAMAIGFAGHDETTIWTISNINAVPGQMYDCVFH